MSEHTAIEWTGGTWNPWQGCHKVSQGCKFCYMYRDKERYGQDPHTVVRSANATFRGPLSRTKFASGSMVFTCSWSDWFIEEADRWRPEAWDIVRARPDLTFQILTKRADRIAAHLPSDWGEGWRNVWLGVSVENQSAANARIPYLLSVPARVRFLSCEPLLGAVDLRGVVEEGCGAAGCTHTVTDALSGLNECSHGYQANRPTVHWVICGGESGAQARSMEPVWAESLRDQCGDAGVAFFMKQMTKKAPIPPALMVRQFPESP